MSSQAWRDVDGEVRSITLTATTSCDHCALPVPINGPVQVLHCPHCSKDTPIAHFYQILSMASARRSVRGAYEYAWFDDPSPECARCSKSVSIPSYLRKEGATTTLPCASCGAPMPTFPAPAWLKERFPTALQVLGGDAEVAREQAGIELVVDEAAAKPIATPCPSCGGGLTLQRDTDRTVTCRFCSTSVFIPDELWKRLHPIKAMLRWTLTFRDKLACDVLDTLEASDRLMEAADRESEEAARNYVIATIDVIRLHRDRARTGFDLDAEIAEERRKLARSLGDSQLRFFDEQAAALRPAAPPPPPAPGATLAPATRRVSRNLAWAVALGVVALLVAGAAVTFALLGEPAPPPAQKAHGRSG